MNQKKILVATGIYPPETGGPATHAVFLEKSLPQFGITPTVLPYRIVRGYPKILRHIAYTIALLFASRGHDGIYALDTISVGVPAMIVSIITRKKLLLRVPGDYAWEQGQQRFGVTVILDDFLQTKQHSFFVRCLQWLQKKVAEHATHIIVPSDYMKNVVHIWGIPKEKITRVYSVLFPFQVSTTKDKLRKEYGYCGYVVTTAARLVPWKGIEALIKTIHAVREDIPDISLYIIGEGRLFDTLTSCIATLKASSYVHLLGALPHDEVGKRTKATDVFVLNTSYEGMSHHLLEAISLRAPIITTPVGGNVELVTHEETGLMVPYNDSVAIAHAIKRLHDNTEFAQTLSRNAEGVLGSFSEDCVIGEIYAVFKKTWNLSH